MAAKRNKEGDAEKEIIAAFARKPDLPPLEEECLRPDLLERFAAGQVRDKETQNLVLAHLSQCRNCMSIILAFKRKSAIERAEKYQRRMARVPLLLAVPALLAIVFVIWHNRDRLRPVETAVLDLRSDVTRSTDTSFKVPHKNTRLVIKLPRDSAEGTYEVDLLKGEPANSALRGSGQAQRRTDDVELEIELNFARVTSGHYLLAVWTGNANPRYQAILVE
jgi:hypothetical protein